MNANRLYFCPIMINPLLALVKVIIYLCTQVNADIRYYTTQSDGTKILSRVNTSHVGKNISTKAIKSNRREDVTFDG